jgi:chorismate synthase
MANNTFGEIFRVTTFGESHGEVIGAVIDGCPAGLEIDYKSIQHELDRRKPGQSGITTQRKESDTVQILSGVYNNKTLGSPIALLIKNEDQKPQDYEKIKTAFRPSHADYTYLTKYGLRDYRGGGRSSARATAALVAAGSIAKQLINQLEKNTLDIYAYVAQVGKIKTEKSYKELQLDKTDNSIVRCPDEEKAKQMIALIEKTRDKGDSLGGVITGVIQNCPVGLGEPIFDKLQADLAKAMFCINAVHGFEYGSGFEGSSKYGSENNDEFTESGGKIITKTNYSGGIQGGISNGMDIYFNVAFKPTSTIKKPQQTVNEKNEKVTIEPEGRHDPCVLPRAVPIVEAMAALVIADHLLRNRASKV